MSLKINFECDVKPSDIDEFGHLHNSSFPEYFDRARENLQNKLNLSNTKLISQNVGLLINEGIYKYKNQVKVNNKLNISAELKYAGGVKCFIEYEMKSKDVLMSTAKTTHYFFDLQKQKPIKPLEEFLDLF